MQRNQAGFTLTELILVIGILGILITIGLANYSGVRQKSHESAAQQHGAGVAVAVQQWLSQNPTRSLSALDTSYRDCTQPARLTSPLPATPDRNYRSGDIGWAAAPPQVTCQIGGGGRNVEVITGTEGGSRTFKNGEAQ